MRGSPGFHSGAWTGTGCVRRTVGGEASAARFPSEAQAGPGNERLGWLLRDLGKRWRRLNDSERVRGCGGNGGGADDTTNSVRLGSRNRGGGEEVATWEDIQLAHVTS
jgi:hypothetical protein